MSVRTLFTSDGRRDFGICASNTGGDSNVGLVGLDVNEEHCENGEANGSEGGRNMLSTSDADLMLSFFGRRL